jgi:nitroreductase
MGARAPMATPADAGASADFAAALIHSRRTVLPRRLVAPGPDADELQRILEAAAAAPDHDQRTPWRFVIVGQATRPALADVFASALRERDADATTEQIAQAREKAFRAPLLLLAVVRAGLPGDDIPLTERLLSAGCAIQNMLLMATAFGYGSALTSGKAMQSRSLRALFALGSGEQALCFMSIGTAASARPPKPRPAVQSYVRELEAPVRTRTHTVLRSVAIPA